MNRHLAIFDISPRLLSQLLGLPEGARVVGLSERFSAFYSDGPVLSVKVEHSALPATPEGCEIKVVRPTWKAVTALTPKLEAWDCDG